MRELFGKQYAARNHRPPLACRHASLPQIVARLGVPDRSFVAYRQLVTAFRAAPRQNCPTILARHTSTETMRLCPFAVIGLKCTFWHLGSIATGRRAPMARPCTEMNSVAFSIHEPGVGQVGNLRPIGNRPRNNRCVRPVLPSRTNGMKHSRIQALLRHPDAIALMIIAMAILSRAGPPHCLLRIIGLI